MNKKEKLFLKDLSEVLKKHNANLNIEATNYWHAGSEAELTFDIIDVSCDTLIKRTKTSGQEELTHKDIDKIIKD